MARCFQYINEGSEYFLTSWTTIKGLLFKKLYELNALNKRRKFKEAV
jgi:hypothetical protein